MKHVVVGILCSLAGSVVTLVQAGESAPIELNKVPKEIREAAQAVMPEAKFHSANTEQESYGLVYEIQGKTSDGRTLEVDVLESGKVEEIEVEFSRDLLPGAVIKAIEKEYPGFEYQYIEASHSASKKVMQYEFVGAVGDRTLDLEVSADGRRIVEADD